MYSATSELDMYVKSTISNVMLQYLWCYGAVSNLKSDCADTRPKPSQGTVHMPMSSRDLDCIGVHLSKSEKRKANGRRDGPDPALPSATSVTRAFFPLHHWHHQHGRLWMLRAI